MVRYDVMHTADIPVLAADVAQDNHQAGEHRQQSKHAIEVVQELTRGLVVLQWERFAHHGFLITSANLGIVSQIKLTGY